MTVGTSQIVKKYNLVERYDNLIYCPKIFKIHATLIYIQEKDFTKIQKKKFYRLIADYIDNRKDILWQNKRPKFVSIRKV